MHAEAPEATADVTVLVVAFRHEKYVEACLESIRTQTVSPAAVIIADDCSPDGTAQVVEDYLARHPGFATFLPNAENRGLNPTLNEHLDGVTTEYFTYISADDTMLPQRIARHVELLERQPDAVLGYSDAHVIDAAGALLHDSSRQEFPWPEDAKTRAHPFAELMYRNWMPAASLFFRTRRLQDAGGYRGDLFYEDLELLVRLSKHSPFAWTDEPLVCVRRLETSLGATGFVSENPRFIEALDATLRHYEDAPADLARDALSKRWELAKRSVRSTMAPRRSLQLLRDARGGSSGLLAQAKQGALWTRRALSWKQVDG
ncbi:family 2 glycosyl transferase [Brachybacterium phenoliresistens]|uniref:Family 2 glycosyl transferase n=1 Tax=Brachybacterium phenoliresistens TaxID=396014 RepID=Z9JUV4_9MICO|nr:glycosyltransferase family A protein [Brachybacterium phenoliresistens]EWS81551.1 family 2 glycosyl transferase [Brachybacterium phenoliresistens]